MSPGESRGTDGLRHSLSDATRRIEEIVDAAEGVASEIRSDAEREADRYLGRRRADADALVRERVEALDELSASLVDKASGLEQRAAEIATEIEAVISRMQELSAGQASAGPALAEQPPSAAPARPEQDEQEDEASTQPVAYAGTGANAEQAEGEDENEAADTSEADAAGNGGASEEALLRATQMAVAGSDREEIERTLRTEFSVDDPSAIVDEILGPA